MSYKTFYLQVKMNNIYRKVSTVPLKKLIKIETGKRPKGGGALEGEVITIGGEHIDKSGNILWDKNLKYISEKFYQDLTQGKVKEEDILLVKDGATTGKVAFVEDLPYEKVAVNEHLFIIRIKENKLLLSKYLFFVLLSFIGQNHIRRVFQGIIGGIKKKDVENLKIPLPPLPIQQKIVRILDTLQSAVKIQNRIIELSKEFKKSLMAELFKYGAPSFRKGRKLKKTEIGEIPEDWEVRKAEEFCVFVTDGTHDTPKPAEDGYYLITSKNLKEGKIDFTQAYKITEEDFDKVNKRSKVDQYDVLFSMIGTVGLTVLVKDENPSFAIKNVGLFKLGGDYLKSLYLTYYLQSNKAKIFVRNNMKRTTQQYFTLGLLRSFPIVTPSNRKEQQEIAEILSTIDKKIEIEEKKKKLYEELFKTVLNKIMNGEIDVESIKI